MASNSNPFCNCKALVFDLMGTCTNWHSSILAAMEQQRPPLSTISPTHLSEFALKWRSAFFSSLHSRFAADPNAAPEDIDITHRRTLDSLLAREGLDWPGESRKFLVQAWHSQVPWPDVVPAMHRFRKKFFVVVLANGTTRLQLDLVRSSDIPFHMLFSSKLLGLTKPNPQIYRRAAELMGLEVEECVMVAAHAYDLDAAKGVGMKTAYIRRDTEDADFSEEDFESVRERVDFFMDGREGENGRVKEGLGALADVLGV